MKKFIAEIIGTFGLLFCGCGAMTINEITSGSVSHVGVAITWGLIVMGMIYAFGEISGAHLNPAVTIAFAYAKLFAWKDVPKYILAQTIGGFLALLLLWFLFPESVDLGRTNPAENFPAYKAFVLELVLTYFLMLVIITVSTGSKETGMMAAVAIGGIVLLEAMFAGPMTKASMNPVRSLAPAIVSGKLEHLWLYLTAPIIGAILAVMSCKLVKEEKCCNEKC